MPQDNKPHYYVLDSASPNMMLLYPPPNPSLRDRWLAGRRFQKPPQQPVVVRIQPNNERGDLLPFFGTARLVSDAFYQALREAGVDNLDVYEAVIQSEDGSIEHRGFKAFNLIGVLQVADLQNTIFNDPPGTKVIDASIERLAIDSRKAHGLLMFRLAEYLGAVIVHERVKRVVDAKNFPYIVFREPSEFIS